MPTYLVAFVICDYDHVNRTERGKEVSEEDSVGKEECTGCRLFIYSFLHPVVMPAYPKSIPSSLSQAL